MTLWKPSRQIIKPTRRDVCRGLGATGASLILPRRGEAQPVAFTSMGSLRNSYVALKYGFLVHFNMYTYSQTHNANQTINTFAPSTTDFISNWVTTAQAAGIKYCGLTAKHIDGFCIWNTASTTYNVTGTTWYQTGGGFDIVGQFCTQMRAAGIVPVLYFSLQDNTYSGGFSGSALSFKAYTKLQMQELLTNYGAITGVWLDSDFGAFDHCAIPCASVDPFSSNGERINFIHNLQPNCLDLKNTHVYDHGLQLTDIMVLEATLPNSDGTYPSEMAETGFTGSLWFWHSGYSLKTVGNHTTVGTLAYDLFTSHNSNATYTLGVGPDQTGHIPSDIVTQVTNLGTFN